LTEITIDGVGKKENDMSGHMEIKRGRITEGVKSPVIPYGEIVFIMPPGEYRSSPGGLAVGDGCTPANDLEPIIPVGEGPLSGDAGEILRWGVSYTKTVLAELKTAREELKVAHSDLLAARLELQARVEVQAVKAKPLRALYFNLDDRVLYQDESSVVGSFNVHDRPDLNHRALYLNHRNQHVTSERDACTKLEVYSLGSIHYEPAVSAYRLALQKDRRSTAEEGDNDAVANEKITANV
jgi:hypothetical protein